MKKTTWVLFVFFAIVIGLYPTLYLIIPEGEGFLSTKPDELLRRTDWQVAFYQHIFFGGVALLAGWSQFSKKLRSKRIALHRTLGKIYVVSCLLSGLAGFYLALNATGGWISSLGFGSLAVCWLIATSTAFLAIRKRDFDRHEQWMIRSYALTFAAVALRVWLPLMQVSGIEFLTAYRIVAWLCWVPNILLAEWLILRMRKPIQSQST